MTKEEFYTKLEEEASAYALDCVIDASEHMDAVDAIKGDFIEGGIIAYCILNNTTWDDNN